MTACVATVTPDAAWISADGAIGMGSPAQIARMRVIAGIGDDNITLPTELTPRPLFRSAAKVIHFPKGRMAIAKLGALGPPEALLLKMQLFGMRTVDQFEDRIAAAWAKAGRWIRRAPILLVAIGWSERRDRCIGIIAGSADAMLPEEFTEGHFVSPELDGRFPECAELAMIEEDAGEGSKVERFHELCLLNATRQAHHDLTGGIVVGGIAKTVMVDRMAAQIARSFDLDELVEASPVALPPARVPMPDVAALLGRQNHGPRA